MNLEIGELDLPSRVLMGPGPSDVSARVLRALAAPTIGHLDPEYLRIMDDTRKMLQHVFRTRNPLTVAMPGTGSAGMETCVANLIEPGNEMIVCVNGVFGTRMVDVAQRCGAVVHPVEAPWGEIIDDEAIRTALADHPATKVVGIVHAETSTGAHQPLQEISRLVHDAGALFLVDAVTSFAGVELDVDGWRIDACYSGTQKCLSCPPGLSPVTVSPAAVEMIQNRTSKVQSWYLDLTMISKYWGENRVYHHTAPINMSYALYEALRMVIEEGLEPRLARHQLNHRALRAGLEAMGLSYIPKHSLPNLNAIHVPPGADDAVVRQRLLDEYGIEIGAGLGPFKGKAWRIGIMGSSCTRRHVVLVLGALESILTDMGVSLPKGKPLLRQTRPMASDRQGVTGLLGALVATVVVLALAGCTTDVDLGNGVTQRGDHLFFYEGPEVEATLGTHETTRSLGENWLVLGVWLRATSQSGTLTIDRKAIAAVTPDGHRIPLVSQEEYRSAYSQIHTSVRRAEFSTLGTGSPTAPLQICDRWFFAEIGEGFATDELYLTSFMQCTGPLVFNVQQGVQPGRWHLVIDLEESRVDIPFEVAVSY